MITPKEAYIRFKAEHRDLEVKEAALYKAKAYIFVAPKLKTGVDYNAPFYSVDARTGRVGKFNPAEDLIGFQDAMANHPVDWR